MESSTPECVIFEVSNRLSSGDVEKANSRVSLSRVRPQRRGPKWRHTPESYQHIAFS